MKTTEFDWSGDLPRRNDGEGDPSECRFLVGGREDRRELEVIP